MGCCIYIIIYIYIFQEWLFYFLNVDVSPKRWHVVDTKPRHLSLLLKGIHDSSRHLCAQDSHWSISIEVIYWMFYGVWKCRTFHVAQICGSILTLFVYIYKMIWENPAWLKSLVLKSNPAASAAICTPCSREAQLQPAEGNDVTPESRDMATLVLVASWVQNTAIPNHMHDRDYT